METTMPILILCYGIFKMPRYMAYIWTDINNEKECKFGDHWVNGNKSFEEAKQETIKYIRSSLGRSKHKFDKKEIVVHHVWDVSEYAKRVGRFYKHGKVDDVIRACIGFHIQADFHEIHYQEAIVRINKELGRFQGNLPNVGLSTLQYQTLVDVLTAFKNQKNVILAELCARFGKTIWAGAIIRETQAPITVVASYVLTSFTSFIKDLTSFQQFSNIEYVEASDNNWIEKVKKHRKEGKQVIVYLSMCGAACVDYEKREKNFFESSRNKKIKTLYSKTFNEQILLIIDEADFGVHTQKQALALINAQRKFDRVVLMTGTNAERAASGWNIDHYINVTYPELLMMKAKAKCEQNTTGFKLITNQKVVPKFFNIDKKRDIVAVDVWYYQMNLVDLVDRALAQEFGDVGENGKFLPSWSKLAADPEKSGAVSFFRSMLSAVVGGEDPNGRDYLSARYMIRQVEKTKLDNHRVVMMWLPGSITNANLRILRELAQEVLGGFEIIALSGNEVYDLSNKKFTNRNSEIYTREIIEKAKHNGKNVLILAANMAQRSYSVPEITELYLAYDGGSEAATIQKISRAFTPNGDENKVARVISLSFDPARDDKFDALIIQSAINYQQKNNIVNTVNALEEVLRTINIVRCDKDGAMRFQISSYLNELLKRNSLGRVIGKIANLYKLTAEEIKALAEGKADVFQTPKPNAVIKGKTYDKSKIKKSCTNKTQNDDAKLVARAREIITTLVENIDVFVGYTGMKTLDKALEEYAKDEELRNCLREDFGIEFGMVLRLFERGIINKQMIDLCLYKKRHSVLI